MRFAPEIYERLVDEEDARACDDIPASACHEVPANFLKLLAAQFFTKLGDALASPKIVLPWLVQSVGAPLFVTALLVPVRESGSLIPQIAVGGFIRSYAHRKWFFVAGCIGQGIAVAGIALSGALLDGVAAGIAILGLLVLFSLARGVCSVASKDVVGKTVPKPRRGRLTGFSAAGAGLIGTVLGGWLFWRGEQPGQAIALLVIAATGWLVASLLFATIAEKRGASEGGRNALKLALRSLQLLRSDPPFRRFVVVRALLLSSALSAPFFVVLAGTGAERGNLGLFLLLGGLASLVSGPVWGVYADFSSRRLIQLCAVLTASICALGALASLLDLASWAYAGLFFLLAVTHEGVRVGRKTYLVNLGSGNRRTEYVSVSNTLIGVLLLLVGLATALVADFSLPLLLALFSASALGSALLALRLPEE